MDGFSKVRPRGRNFPWWVGIVAAVGTSFAVLIAVAKAWDSIAEQGFVVSVDRRWLSLLISHRTPWVTTASRAVTWLGDVRILSVLVGLVAIALVLRHERIHAVLLAAATWGAAALDAVVKAVLARPRPPVSRQVVAAAGSAFPSGHAVQAAAFYGALAWILARHLRGRSQRIVIWSAAIVCTGLVGTSRVYLGVHWPSDVGAGWAVGVGWLAVCVGGVLAMRGRLQGPWTLPSPVSARSP